jgi:hypothetical protein
MSEIRFHYLWGGVLLMVVAMAVAQAHAGTVAPAPDAATLPPTLNFDASVPAAEIADAPLAPDRLHVIDSVGLDSNQTIPPVLDPQGNNEVLLLLGNYGSEPAAWSQGFEGGFIAENPAAPIHSTDGLSRAPAPEQVLIPLPSAAWTGLTSLACLALVGMKKHVRRFLS